MYPKIIDIIGWVLMGLEILAYMLTSLGIVSPATIPYQALSIIASSVLGYIAYKKRYWQSLGYNLIWIIIAIAAILKILIQNHGK